MKTTAGSSVLRPFVVRMRRCVARGLVAFVVAAAIVPAWAADEKFNLEVKAADIALGPQVSGPVIAPESLAHRVVLLEFWGVNCPPCLAAMPKLEEMHRQLAPLGLVIVGAHAQGGTAEEVRRTVNELGVTFPILENARVEGGTDFEGIPHCMLFDHTGKCLYRGSPFEVHNAVVAAVRAAPAAILEGRTLAKFPNVNRELQSELSYGKVLQKMRQSQSAKDEETAAEAKFVVEKLEARAEQMVADAESLHAKDPLAAIELMDRCARAFKGTPVGIEANKKLRDYKKDPALQAAMRAEQQLAVLRRMEATARQSLTGSPDGEITPQMLEEIPPAFVRQVAEIVQSIERMAPGSPAAEKANKIGKYLGVGAVATP